MGEFMEIGKVVMKHEDVIKVDNKMLLINEVGKDRIHKGLKGGWGVAKAKGHYQGFKKAEGAFKGGFPLVTFMDTNIVISLVNVKFSKIARSLEFVNKIEDQGKWGSILDSNFIKVTVILDRT